MDLHFSERGDAYQDAQLAAIAGCEKPARNAALPKAIGDTTRAVMANSAHTPRNIRNADSDRRF